MNAHCILRALIMGVGLSGTTAPALADSDVVATLPQNTRVVPFHVYEDRQQARDVVVPYGYRRVWDDDRLNPQRGITTLKPTNSGTYAAVPPGYKSAWNDNRLNPNRGRGTAHGDVQSDQVWSQTVPRVLMPVAAPQRLYDGPTPRRQQKTPIWETR
ncbi:hypothetical protein [Sedimentitalea sp.]|uniref:hypothetical protein n=1 Tax=Sedimentitalea sp. TaxID=2048915 RepID=UPI0032992AA5